jgi:Methyltransferase domain
MANNPEECQAKQGSNVGGKNPRYIEKELEMAYGTDGNGNPRTRGVLVRRLTGDSTPYSFPVSPIRLVKEWPQTPPFRPEDFLRSDSNDDGWFYKVPRLVYHIDEPAVASLTQYYRNNIPPKSDILDICSSWVSHYPLEFPDIMGKICATGMSSLELQFNDQLTGGYEQKDLNVDPKLPYPDASFDVVTCVVSIDYLIEPVKVLQEVHRVLRPGGKIIVSQSNRCFPSKAIAMVRTRGRQGVVDHGLLRISLFSFANLFLALAVAANERSTTSGTHQW